MPSILRRLAAAALVVTAAACADSPTAPTARVAAKGVDFSLIGTLTQIAGDTTTKVFTVDPTTSTTFQVGSGHVVYFPSNSICELGSSYGPGEWDKPCVTASSPITITAKSWIDGDGHPQVDFSPAMRFTNAEQQQGLSSGAASGDVVTIGLALDRLSIVAADDQLTILYCATPTSSCVDESISDAALRTTTSLDDGYVARRIKHFSGYNVSSGREGGEMTMEGSRARTGHLMSSGRIE
jgi:hypothetical protein